MKCDRRGCKQEATRFPIVEVPDMPVDLEPNFCEEHFEESFPNYVDESTQLTDEDFRNIQYFHQYKGDITRWCDWEKRHLLKKQKPALYNAFLQLEIAQETLNELVKAL